MAKKSCMLQDSEVNYNSKMNIDACFNVAGQGGDIFTKKDDKPSVELETQDIFVDLIRYSPHLTLI